MARGGLNAALVAVVIGGHRRHRLVDPALRLGPGPINLIKLPDAHQAPPLGRGVDGLVEEVESLFAAVDETGRCRSCRCRTST